MTSIQEAKQTLRQEALAQRAFLDEATFQTLNEALVSRVIEYLNAHRFRRIGVFYPLSKEVDLRALDHHFETFYPLIEDGKLTFAPHVGRFVKAPFNTRVPNTKARLEGSLDAVLVPGLWFDHQGYRLGYGKGYYDGYLKSHQGMKIGVCFTPFFRLDLPKEDHDQAVDCIITENQTLCL